MESSINTNHRVPIVMYHRIGKAENDWEARYSISPDKFKDHMHILKRRGYNAITIDALINWINEETVLPKNPILITFDDGFRGVREHGAPVLNELKWPYTVFLVSDLIGKDDCWTRSSNPSGKTFPLLDWDDINKMKQQGASFHSHTRTHKSLPTLNDDQLLDQLSGSRTLLSQKLHQEVRYIAYPFGHENHRVQEATQAAGYHAAFSTCPGFNRQSVNPFQLRRLEVYGTDSTAMLLRKIKFGWNDGSLSHALLYYFNRFKSHLLGVK